MPTPLLARALFHAAIKSLRLLLVAAGGCSPTGPWRGRTTTFLTVALTASVMCVRCGHCNGLLDSRLFIGGRLDGVSLGSDYHHQDGSAERTRGACRCREFGRLLIELS